ncbi:MAG: NAD(P)/FAD-dependent oxidoreductase [Elusimicrobia bacterium]|nr:NAD(P)/FAD-dependent oxidoreductase [Elusimicrobiota bacterium]
MLHCRSHSFLRRSPLNPFNVLIIGAGPAGEAASKAVRRLVSPVAAGRSEPPRNVQITLVEKEEAGGLCLNRGCIPSKTLLEHVRRRTQVGLPVEWAEIQAAKKAVIQGIRSQLESSLKSNNIQLLRGTARFHDRSTVEIDAPDGRKLVRFDKAILTAGTETVLPPPLDKFKEGLLDSDRMLEVSKTPASLTVIGGGAVGCEFACLLHAAGSKVTIVEMTDGLLPGEDPAIVAALTRSFEARGIVIKTGVRVTAVERAGETWKLTLSNGETIESEQTLVSAGRGPRFEALGLDRAGVEADRRLVVNEFLQTTNPDVYAAGDVAGTRLAHAAAAQGEVAAANALGGSKLYDGSAVPRCLYSWPEVASVGAWKYEREKDNLPVRATRAFFQGSAKAHAAGEIDGFVQIVSDPTDGRILGAQIIGAHATELIHIFSVALKKDMTTAELADVMFAHPTLGETIREAARR